MVGRPVGAAVGADTCRRISWTRVEPGNVPGVGESVGVFVGASVG